ncbi:hypothetical protein R2362_03300 [Mycobacteroides chelonae]|nr:hypothetical protein [Mycobacteroides chelonae]
MAYYTCALPFADLESSARLDALVQANRQLGWWWPMNGVAVLTDRPTVLRRDDQGRLHSEHGPALLYADGYSFHGWHGISVPEWVIDSPSLEKAMAESNTEIRRCAFESLGWDKAIQELGIEPIDTCRDFANGDNNLELYRLPDKVNPYGQPVNLLLMVNGSPDRDGGIRRYGETVPASISKADAAAAWQYGVDPAVYRQLARRT